MTAWCPATSSPALTAEIRVSAVADDIADLTPPDPHRSNVVDWKIMKHKRRRWFCAFPRKLCSCGLRWPCPDNVYWGLGPIPDGPRLPINRIETWDCPTVASPQIGRAGLPTPGQAHRSKGGRW
jgi:hypothetical protein